MDVPTVRESATVSSRGLPTRMGARGARRRVRIATNTLRTRPCVSVACLLTFLLAGAAHADTVRVGIVEGAKRLEVSDASGRAVVVAATGAGLAVAGRDVGMRHKFPASAGPYRLKAVGRGSWHLRGGLAVVRGDSGFYVVNRVPLEDYVAGTLGGEMISSWAPAALRAQAVACRSFVLYQMARRASEPFDVTADVSSQRYLGVEGESDAAWAAVRATRGEVLRDSTGPVLAAFHSASGGRTASAAEVWGTPIAYLRSVPVESEDASPDTYWRVAVSQQNLLRALEGLGLEIGTVEAVEVSRRSGSGRAAEVRFRGKAGRAKVTGRQLRQALGPGAIRSTMFDVRYAEGEAVFVGSGYGHGVGMSQWAAQGMALEGATYSDILDKFYPGTRLAPSIETASRLAGGEGKKMSRGRPPVAARRERAARKPGATRVKNEGRKADRMGDRRR
ncbi:MAG: SpoIID/LytB domain-containing protein [Myxococcota bacterium]|jgi:stage II sporulation protein D|nr:SpoIID/LytB domain-containing protein [Myxococcota bacterium]